MSIEAEVSGLGHCRLAINDLSPDGEQPLHSPDRSVHAVVNGEIYDYDTVRAHITSVSDYPFKGHSDSELVVALYLIYGRSFLHHLRGEFSLVIYDERNKTFFAARDRFGIKPLFWTRQDGRILIAAEIKGFLGMGWEAEWDVGSIVDGGWGQDTRTMFRGVQKVSRIAVSAVLLMTSSNPGTTSLCCQEVRLRPESIGMQTTRTRYIGAMVPQILADELECRRYPLGSRNDSSYPSAPARIRTHPTSRRCTGWNLPLRRDRLFRCGGHGCSSGEEGGAVHGEQDRER
jgi:hypothetical protein